MTAPTGQRGHFVDPRLRARRDDVLREQGRRRLRRVQVAGTVLTAGGLAWAALMSPLLDVDQVIVRGTEPSRAETIKRSAAVEPGSALATLDLDPVRMAAEAVPWIDTAVVSRAWPGTVAIEVSERVPLAEARLPGGRMVLVDAERQLALMDEEQDRDLPIVVGAIAEARPGAPLDDIASGALELAMRLGRSGDVLGAGGGRGGAPEIVLSEDGTLDINLFLEDAGEVQVRFGHPVDLDDKIRAAAALLESQALSGLESAVVDVRVPEAPVITPTAALGAPSTALSTTP